MQRLSVVALGSLGLLACQDPSRPPQPLAATAVEGATRPNFLVIISDDQHPASFTRTYMPLTFSKLVDHGVRFDRAFVTTSLCCPSRSSILTGMYARHHGVRQNADPLSRTTVIQRLKAAGYYTGLVGKYLNSFNHRSGRLPELDFAVFGGNVNEYYNPGLSVNGTWATRGGYITYLLRDYALQFLRQAPQDRPFLLFFTPNAPHEPADPAPGDEALYPNLARHCANGLSVGGAVDPIRGERPLTRAAPSWNHAVA